MQLLVFFHCSKSFLVDLSDIAVLITVFSSGSSDYVLKWLKSVLHPALSFSRFTFKFNLIVKTIAVSKLNLRF